MDDRLPWVVRYAIAQLDAGRPVAAWLERAVGMLRFVGPAA
ncbi:MAG TPA: hypothetical protein VN213_07490 [Solirubrobacteraceae bacterium]|nr:hypothetical protein [Solirubrobacteraceae bacterium]